jgi:hypothetical protein
VEGKPRNARRSRAGAVAASVAALALVLGLSACGGGGESSSANEPGGTYPVKVVTAEFPAKQQLGETTLLRLGVRNTGEESVPGLTVTISVGGKEGRDSSLPFGYRDPQPGIAQPDRPVWALSARYPKSNHPPEPAGAETASPKTFDFGPLDPGKTLQAVWKLSAVKTGRYKIFYEVGAGLGGKSKTKTENGAEPGGVFAVTIAPETPEVEVTDSGEVIEIPEEPKQGNR